MTAAERTLKLLQGYIWHPRDEAVDLGDYLPKRLEPDLHSLWDAMPAAPFTFFDDGTMSATQQVYQFTVVTQTEDSDEAVDEAQKLVPWLAETLQARLDATPPGVGWQIFEDLRDV
ncbi:DUF3208 domain-containing protein [soil metagenome]